MKIARRASDCLPEPPTPTIFNVDTDFAGIEVDFYPDDGTAYNNEYEVIIPESSADLESEGKSNLALFDLSVAKPAESGTENNIFYAVSFILGTRTGGPNIAAQGQSCAAPNDYQNDENFEYCSINKFNFAAEAIGK